MYKRSNITVMFSLVKMVTPLLIYMFLAIMLGVIGHLCAGFIVVLGGMMVLNGSQLLVIFDFSTLIILIILCALLRGVFRYGEQALNHYIAFKLLALIRHKVFLKLRELAPAKLEVRNKGDLISVITSDIELLEVFYAHTISPIMIALLYSLIMVLLIGLYHWLLAVFAGVAYLFIGFIIPVIISSLNGNNGNLLREKSGQLSSYVLDSLRGLREVIQYNNMDYRLLEMDKLTKEMLEVDSKMKVITGINQSITNISIWLFDIGILVIAIALFRNQMLSFEGVLMSLLILMSSFGPVIALANLGSTLQNTLAAGNRVLDILDEVPLVKDVCVDNIVDFENLKIENLSFGYDEGLVLKDVNLKINKGQLIGIEGVSGSGKSTLLKLLMRFWRTNNSIKFSDIDINEIDTKNLREIEGYMTQETHLFNDTIKNNLLIAKLDASDEEIIRACKKASIHEFIISLPLGYDSLVGELGDKLSGGERQRIGLARLFLRDADLWLLDEPTSNLDSLNEAIVLRSLIKSKQDKTILLISHRHSTLKIVDSIYQISEGAIQPK